MNQCNLLMQRSSRPQTDRRDSPQFTRRYHETSTEVGNRTRPISVDVGLVTHHLPLSSVSKAGRQHPHFRPQNLFNPSRKPFYGLFAFAAPLACSLVSWALCAVSEAFCFASCAVSEAFSFACSLPTPADCFADAAASSVQASVSNLACNGEVLCFTYRPSRCPSQSFG